MRWAWLGALGLALALAACDGGEVVQIPYGEVRQAAAQGDGASFQGYFDGIKGKRVAWDGVVVEVQRQVEDDFVQSGLMLVAVEPGADPGVPDVAFTIPASKLDAFRAGQKVRVEAVIREYELNGRAALLKLEMKALQ